MRHAGRVTVLVAMLLVGGCGSPGGAGTPAPPRVGDASQVDMCTVLADAELGELGINLDSREQVNELGVVGCQWIGDPLRLRLERNEDTVAEYVARRDSPAFTSFRQNSVNGRDGVQFGVRRSGEQCVQLMDGGPVSLAVGVAAVFGVDPAELDPCAEALRIAEMIEPRLPEAGA